MTFLTAQQPKDSFMGSQGAFAHVSHFGALKTSPTHPVLKANFPGVTLDTTLWTETLLGAATNPIGDGVAQPTVTTAAGDSVILQSTAQGIFEAGQVTVFQSGVYPGVGLLNNVRRWGLMDATQLNGLFFEWNNAIFQVTARKAGVDTSVASGSFNGETGWEPGDANNTFRIFYSAGRAIFCRAQAGNIRTLHTMVDTQFPLVEDLDLGLYYENTNTGATTSGIFMRLRGASSSIFGELPTTRAGGEINNETVLEPVKAVLAGRDSQGCYHNVRTNHGSALLTADFNTEVALGNVPNFSSLVKFGISPTINIAGAPQDVWQGIGLYTGQPVGVVETVDVFSSSGLDTAAGTGAQTIRIFGLDGSFNEQQEDITLAGLAPVTSVNTYSRVFRAAVLTAGSTGENQGVITIRHTTTIANVFAAITATYNQTQICCYTVPADRLAVMESLDLTLSRSNGSNGSAEIQLLVREPGSVYQRRRVFELTTNGGLAATSFNVPIVIPTMSDIIVRIQSVSDNATTITASFGLILQSTI